MGFHFTRKPFTWLSDRTHMVTVVSVIVVAIAGAVALAANLGILDPSSEKSLGSATINDLVTPPTETVEVGILASEPVVGPDGTGPAEAGADGAGQVQHFDAGEAGTVSIAQSGGGIRLEGVGAATGWTWKLAQNSPTTLKVTLTDGVGQVVLDAGLNPDGSVAASLSRSAAASQSGASDSHDDDDDDHHGDDHDDHHDDDHGDDHHYEGGDDDD